MEKKEKGIEGSEKEAALQTVAAHIRKASEEGRLISEAEIRQKTAESHLLPPTARDEAEEGGFLRKLVEENEDLRELTAPDGSLDYYSSDFMTEAYAQILSLKRGGPLMLIAEIVRQNSAFYPRPVPLDAFIRPPFGLTEERIQAELEKMKTVEEYKDIASTTTSSPRVFLYSTRHLEPDHAAMLAEWSDVGQFENP